MRFSSSGIARTINPCSSSLIAISSCRRVPNPTGTLARPVVSSVIGATPPCCPAAVECSAGARSGQSDRRAECDEPGRLHGAASTSVRDRLQQLDAALARVSAERNYLLGLERERARDLASPLLRAALCSACRSSSAPRSSAPRPPPGSPASPDHLRSARVGCRATGLCPEAAVVRLR